MTSFVLFFSVCSSRRLDSIHNVERAILSFPNPIFNKTDPGNLMSRMPVNMPWRDASVFREVKCFLNCIGSSKQQTG